MRRAAAWAVSLAALAPPSASAEPPAQAGAPHTVVVLRTVGSDDVTREATARVQGELGAAGFRVAVVSVQSDHARSDVETAGSELSPIGAFAIFVHPEEGGAVAEIWVSDRLRQKTVIQRARLTETDHQRESEILAVRAVELLKASLAEFWLQPSAPSPPPPAPPAPVEPARPVDVQTPRPAARESPRRPAFASGVGVGVGAGMIDGFRNVGPVWVPMLVASVGWESGVSLQLDFHGLGPAATINAPGGSARVEERFATIGAMKTWWPRWAVVPFACAGIGVHQVHVSGIASSPASSTGGSYKPENIDDWSLFTSAGIGAAVPVHGTLSVVFQSRAAAAWPATAVRIAQADAGHAQVDVGHVGGPSLLVDANVLGVFP